MTAVRGSVTNLEMIIFVREEHLTYCPSLTRSWLMQMWASHAKESAQPKFCEFLKAVMTRLNPLLADPQLSVWYLRVTKLVLVMMNPLLPTLRGSESHEMWACRDFEIKQN